MNKLLDIITFENNFLKIITFYKSFHTQSLDQSIYTKIMILKNYYALSSF